MLGFAPSVVGRCCSSKGLQLPSSNSVLRRLGMPSPHETPIDITKLLRASARYLSLRLPVQQSLFSTSQRHPYRTTFEFSATFLLSPLGASLSRVSPGHRQTYSSSIEFA